VASREQQRKAAEILHASIAPEFRDAIDTQQWVFFPCAPATIL
jgi:hypothetical protein